MNKKQLFLIVALLAGLILAAGAAFSAARAGTALLSLDPQTTTAGPGENVGMSMQLESATAASGVDIHLAYDPAILLVLDSDAVTAGVQIQPGTCPEPDFVILNEANVVSGTIQYAVVDVGLESGCTSGEVAQITFQCVGLGTSDVTFSPETEISDPDGITITLTTQNAAITCTDVTSTPGPTPTATEAPATPGPIYLPLALRPAPCLVGPNEQEPNDSASTATGPLCLNQDYFGTPDDTLDYFYFTLATPGPITLDLTNHPLASEHGTQVQLYYQSVVPANKKGEALLPPYQITYEGEAGTYYVVVFNDISKCDPVDCSVKYTLRVSYTLE